MAEQGNAVLEQLRAMRETIGRMDVTCGDIKRRMTAGKLARRQIETRMAGLSQRMDRFDAHLRGSSGGGN